MPKRPKDARKGWLKKEGRLIWRRQGEAVRFYGDFRNYRDVGGGQEALIAPGEKRATTERDVAQKLLAARVEELDAARRRRGLHSSTGARLADFCRQHLIAKK